MEKVESSYYKDYKELKNYRNGKKFYEGRDKTKVLLMKIGLSGFSIASIIMGVTCGGALLFSGDSILETLSIIIPMGTCMISYYVMDLVYPEYESRVNKKSFKKKYSNVDMDISDEQLNSFLEYASDKKIEEQNENKDDLFNDFKYMSNDAKIAFLKEQKEYWENVSLKEKYERKSKTKVLKK